MIFVEFLYRLVTLDIIWFMMLFANNLLITTMVFIVMAVFFGFNLKKAAFATALIFVQIWVIDDAVTLLGGFFISGAFLLIYYVSKLSVLTAVDEDERLKKHIIPINEAAWMVPLILYNLYMMRII